MARYRRCASLGLCLTLLSVLAGCEGDPGSVLVDLKTDYVAGQEFVRVRTVLVNDSGEAELGEVSFDASTGDDFIRGTRVAELDLVGWGHALLLTELYDAGGEIIAVRRSRVSIGDSNTAVTVLISRDCAAVDCTETAGTGSALVGGASGVAGRASAVVDGTSALTECFAGRCVSPDCTEENIAACGDAACTADSDCAVAAPCGEGRCVAGGCFSEAVSSRCAADEYCDPAAGCTPAATTDAGLDGGADSGPDASDAGLDASDTGVSAPDGGVDAGPDAMADAAMAVCLPAGAGTVSLFTLDDAPGDGVVSDATGFNNGLLRNRAATSFVPGAGVACGLGIDFDPLGPSYVDIADVPEYDIADGCIEFYVRPDALHPSGAALVSQAGSDENRIMEIGLTPTGELYAHFLDTTLDDLRASCSETPLALGAWHHVVVDFGAAGLALYVDGTRHRRAGLLSADDGPFLELECGVFTDLGLDDVGGYPLVLGASNHGSTVGTTDSTTRHFTDGVLDHVRVSNRRCVPSTV